MVFLQNIAEGSFLKFMCGSGEIMKADVINKYFRSWINVDVEVVKQTFSENAVYIECYGSEY